MTVAFQTSAFEWSSGSPFDYFKVTANNDVIQMSFCCHFNAIRRPWKTIFSIFWFSGRIWTMISCCRSWVKIVRWNSFDVIILIVIWCGGVIAIHINCAAQTKHKATKKKAFTKTQQWIGYWECDMRHWLCNNIFIISVFVRFSVVDISFGTYVVKWRRLVDEINRRKEKIVISKHSFLVERIVYLNRRSRAMMRIAAIGVYFIVCVVVCVVVFIVILWLIHFVCFSFSLRILKHASCIIVFVINFFLPSFRASVRVSPSCCYRFSDASFFRTIYNVQLFILSICCCRLIFTRVNTGPPVPVQFETFYSYAQYKNQILERRE